MHGLEFTMCLVFVFAFMSVRILEQFFFFETWKAGVDGVHRARRSRLLRFEDAWRMAGLIGDQDEV